MSRSATAPANNTKTIVTADGRTVTILYRVRLHNNSDYVLVSDDGYFTFYGPQNSQFDSNELVPHSVTMNPDSEPGSYDFEIIGDKDYIRGYFPAFGLETPWMEMRMGFHYQAEYVDVNDADYVIDGYGYLRIFDAEDVKVLLKDALWLTGNLLKLASLEHADTQRAILGVAYLQRQLDYLSCSLHRLCEVSAGTDAESRATLVPIPQRLLTLARRVSELCMVDGKVVFTELNELQSAVRYLNVVATAIVHEASSRIANDQG